MIEHNRDGHADPRRITWTRLLGDHDRIARQCADLVDLARRPDRPVEIAAIQLLELAVFVADHMGVEDRVIDLTAAAIHAGTSPEAAEAMRVRLDTLKSDWAEFIVRWTPDAIAADWPAFTIAAEAILPRLAAQVRCENDLLYTEALRRGLIESGRAILH